MINGCHYNYPMLIMPCCSEMLELYLYIPEFSSQRIVIDKIIEATVKDTGRLAKLFNAMLYDVTTPQVDTSVCQLHTTLKITKGIYVDI